MGGIGWIGGDGERKERLRATIEGKTQEKEEEKKITSTHKSYCDENENTIQKRKYVNNKSGSSSSRSSMNGNDSENGDEMKSEKRKK